MTLTDIVANIDRRLTQAQVEINHLTAGRAALVDRRQPTPAAKPSRVRRKTASRSYDIVPAGKLTALLANSGGMRTRDLAKASNGDPVQVLALLKEQETTGDVRRSGTRAGTRWHVVTDEDRIAARAAELEDLRRRARPRKT